MAGLADEEEALRDKSKLTDWLADEWHWFLRKPIQLFLTAQTNTFPSSLSLYLSLQVSTESLIKLFAEMGPRFVKRRATTTRGREFWTRPRRLFCIYLEHKIFYINFYNFIKLEMPKWVNSPRWLPAWSSSSSRSTGNYTTAIKRLSFNGGTQSYFVAPLSATSFSVAPISQ